MTTPALRYIRIAIAVLLAVALTLGLLLPQSPAAAVADIIGRAQLIPALAAGAGFWLIAWTVVTLLAGRIYCSTVCPLGTLQDTVLRLMQLCSRRRRPYRFTPGVLTVRFIMLLVIIESLCLGITALTRCLDPYADYVLLTRVFVRMSLAGWAMALLVLGIVIVFIVRRRGRLLCNTVCPVGAMLGAASTMSLMRFDINPDVCTHCRRCEDVCKGRCISSDTGVIDNTRCVVCFDCIAVCPDKAISWRAGRHRLQWPLMQSTAVKPAAIGAVPPCKHNPTENSNTEIPPNETISSAVTAHRRQRHAKK